MSGLGVFLRTLRERRGLSLRELGQLADIDHAYIYRLETGAKESPSEEILSRLIRALKPAKRDADMLKYLAAHPDTDEALVLHVLNDTSVAPEVFSAVAGVVHRGRGRPDYATLIARVRRILDEEAGSG